MGDLSRSNYDVTSASGSIGTPRTQSDRTRHKSINEEMFDCYFERTSGVASGCCQPTTSRTIMTWNLQSREGGMQAPCQDCQPLMKRN